MDVYKFIKLQAQRSIKFAILKKPFSQITYTEKKQYFPFQNFEAFFFFTYRFFSFSNFKDRDIFLGRFDSSFTIYIYAHWYKKFNYDPIHPMGWLLRFRHKFTKKCLWQKESSSLYLSHIRPSSCYTRTTSIIIHSTKINTCRNSRIDSDFRLDAG